MKILVINSGSSSIKYQFFDQRGTHSFAKGIVDRIGSKSSSLKHQKHAEEPVCLKVDAPDHIRAIREIFDVLTHPGSGVIGSYREISGIGHRVVHGAEIFTEPTLIDDKVIRAIEQCNELAPLHNPPALLGIRACRKLVRHIPQVAVFDTAFHQTMHPHAYLYGIPYEFYQKLKIRRYGFHGTSHKFVAHKAAMQMGRPLKGLKLITCHLGNGCSMTAVKNGVSIDTSMGFTPLEGLLMGTRSGDIDPAAVLYIMERKKLSIEKMGDILNKKSGLLGLSGISNDMRDILKAVRKGSARGHQALEIFIYRLKKYIGAYTAAMDGLDAVVLTAGIGEHMPMIKTRLKGDLKGFLRRCGARVIVIPTNEELMIAHETARVILRIKRRG